MYRSSKLMLIHKLIRIYVPFDAQLYTFLVFVPIQSSSFGVPANVVVIVYETDGRGIFLENSFEGILDACVTTWSMEEDTFAGGL